MADVAARKRARSPSPSYGDTLASPLEVLLKRRRRGDFNGRMPPPPVWGAASAQASAPFVFGGGGGTSSSSSSTNTGFMTMAMDDDGDHGASSSHEQSSPLRDGYFGGVERRRQRQWERLQAPSLSQPMPQADSSPILFRTLPASQPNPHPLRPPLQRSFTNESIVSSDVELDVARSSTSAALLSSSPIRHEPPGSTPFRATQWTPEERMREWGDEYASQNSLLHSLHLARYESQQSHPQIPSPHHTPYSNRTMDMSSPFPHTHLTPANAQSHSHHNLAHGHGNGNGQIPTPFRHARGTPSDTPGFGISSPWASSSALNSPHPHDYPSAPNASPVNFGRETEATQASYEEANRLLAELNVQRMRRHGQRGWPSDADDM